MGNTIRKISLVYECDRSTLERAAALANEQGAQLTIVYAVEDIPDRQANVSIGRRSVDVRSLLRRDQQARLKQVAKDARVLGVRRPATRLLIGEPFVEIVRDVLESHRDLVIMTAEGEGGLGERRLFGGTSRHLMRKCPVPLLVVKPRGRPRFQKILAAIDPEDTAGRSDGLNGDILEYAARFARRDGAELHVAHAWSLIGESMYRGRGGFSADQVDALVRAERDRRRRAVEALIAEHASACRLVHLPQGDPATAIPRLVVSQRIDLLVMGTVCRTGIPGLIIGNTAERVLDTVECSVLTVKPKGFTSPVLAADGTR